jgi:hypothetical protein
MSRSPEAYLHTPTAYQTDLSCEAHDAGTHATLRPRVSPSKDWYKSLNPMRSIESYPPSSATGFKYEDMKYGPSLGVDGWTVFSSFSSPSLVHFRTIQVAHSSLPLFPQV